MGTALLTCFGTVVGLVGAILVSVYVVIPIIGHAFTFTGRLIRFGFHEFRDLVLVPIALFVGTVKLLRATLYVILARWDMVHKEMAAAKNRFIEAYDRTVAVFIDNPLRVFAIDTTKQTPAYRPATTNTTNAKFEGYTIVGTLPSGGSGAKLYIATPANNTSSVVIKSFEIATGSQLPQIVRESRAMESAKKLGLVLEHHLDNERFWYAMPYHAGDHLGVVTNNLHGNSNRLSNSQLQTILSYQQSLLLTLHEYHTAGLWHKDVKPDNIIIHDGDAHLVDLGLVTPLASAMTLTTHGTEYFRDPELVRQSMRGVKVHQVDGSKFDVFGAGAVLYFMLENTFPAHGGLSAFSKESPECIRWIVRRAMADYDKRYASIEEMLLDVETILKAKRISSVRPADLPSMGGESPAQQGKSVRRLPAKSTPSTGGGPFKTRSHVLYRAKPSGFVAILVAMAIGVFFVFDNEPPQQETLVTKVLPIDTPIGRVLVVNELSSSPDSAIRKNASNKIAELGVSGWDLFINEDTEAKVRSWLSANPTTTQIPEGKLAAENLSGILFIKEGDESDPLFYFVDQNGAHLFP
jgi:serine/threonine protein kinase